MSSRETATNTSQHKHLDIHFWYKNISVDVKFNTKDVGFGRGELHYTGNKFNSKVDQLEMIYHQLKQQRTQLDNAIKEIEEEYGNIIYTDKNTVEIQQDIHNKYIERLRERKEGLV